MPCDQKKKYKKNVTVENLRPVKRFLPGKVTNKSYKYAGSVYVWESDTTCYCSVLHVVSVHWNAPLCSALHITTVHCIAVNNTKILCTALHRTTVHAGQLWGGLKQWLPTRRDNEWGMMTLVTMATIHRATNIRVSGSAAGLAKHF